MKSGYVLDLEGDLTSSNGADRTDAFDSCMTANDPGVKVLKDPTVWTDATAVTDAQNAINAYGITAQGHLLAVVKPGHRHHPAAQEQGPRPRLGEPGHLDQRRRRAVRDVRHQQRLGHRVAVAARQPVRAVRADLRGRRGQGRQARGRPARRRRADAAERHLPGRHQPRRPDRGAVRDQGADARSRCRSPVDGLPASVTTTAVSDQTLWGNVYGAAHGGVCASS